MWRLRLSFWPEKRENPTCLACAKSNSIEYYLTEYNKCEQERGDLKRIFHNLNTEFTMKAYLHINSDQDIQKSVKQFICRSKIKL